MIHYQNKMEKKNRPRLLRIIFNKLVCIIYKDLILISRLNFIQIFFKVQNVYSSINYGL